ncbi:MAG: hypothetical protein AAB692_05220 [Patescibacteria group bacterium]
MKKFVGALTIALMLMPSAAVFANEGREDMPKIDNREGKGKSMEVPWTNNACAATANKKREAALKTAKQVNQEALKAAQANFKSAKDAAKLLTDQDQRDLAMEAAGNALEDAQVAAAAVLRAARRTADHQLLLDKQACRALLKGKEQCAKTAMQKAQDAGKAAQDAYKSAVEAAKTKLAADKEAAQALPEGDARNQAMTNARHAYEDGVFAAQGTLRLAKRAIETTLSADKKACLPTTTAQ